MSTVSKTLADEIVKNDGFYEDDPRVVQIIEYDTYWGGKAYKLMYRDFIPEETHYFNSPRIYWKQS